MVFLDDVVLKYHFKLWQQHLLRLCATWQRQVRPIPINSMPDSWGPSAEDVQSMLVSEHQPHWGNYQLLDDQVNDDLDEEKEIEFQEDEQLLDAFETSEYIFEDQSSSDFLLEHSFQNPVDSQQASSSSPKKRSRLEYDNM
jgi:hypothetical protein